MPIGISPEFFLKSLVDFEDKPDRSNNALHGAADRSAL